MTYSRVAGSTHAAWRRISECLGGRVWYRIVGDGPRTPLLLLHGGPGAPSYYLEPLAALADERPILFYDQLGCGRSDRPTDPSLWTIERFLEELGQVRAVLRLDRVHILGHSWGTMLAMDYMLTRPGGVQSLILASPALSVSRFIVDAKRLLRTLPEPLQAVIVKHEAEGSFDAPEYQEAVTAFYKLYLCRLDPWPEQLNRMFAEFGLPVYTTMWGPSEFTVTGTLRSYERADRLGELSLPVLFTAGRYDEAIPETTEFYRRQVPDAEIKIFEKSAHMTMLDEADEYVAAVRSFLRTVESRQRSGRWQAKFDVY